MDVDDLIRGPSTPARTSVASGVSAIDILAANPKRRGATIKNTDANALYLSFGSGDPSAADHDILLASGQTLVLNQGDPNCLIRGIWAADGSGHAKVCEFS